MFKPTTVNTFAGQAVVGNDASPQPNTQAKTDDEADTGTQAFKDQLAALQKELELESTKKAQAETSIDKLRRENPEFIKGASKDLQDEEDKVKDEMAQLKDTY